MRLNSISLSLLTCISIFLSCQSKDQNPFGDIPDTYPVLKKVIQNPDSFQVQILYTQINRDENNMPSFREFDFRLNDNKYFYPASTVKLPVAILALEWLGEQDIDGLTANSVMLTDSVRPSQFPAYYDSTASNLLPSIAHYIKKILLVSDNDAYNRLYELLGQDYINSKMQEKGMNHTIINHRLSMPMSEEENRYFNPISFRDEEGEIILDIPERKTESVYANLDHPKIGNAYYSKDELIEEPMDFTFKNKFALSDLHGVVKRIVFPELFAPNERFNITEEDRKFILRYMSMLPGESDYPKYDLPDYYDSYSKFYKFGTDKNPIPAQFRIFNKTGNAYGHLLDGSYFVDFENDIEFFVTAVIYTNANETLNDDTYEYEEIAFPFFAELGEYLYQLELKRIKEKKPVLTELKMDY
ncbi:Beta-lactamase enzyme family protein [Aquiflexum balticum DSM 16537]|uniref:beta-lactamase n=1 Tax=Aquiflexum balticum DSM 16537 TaxID=758820 RepID=A0A1W2H2B2_9BACT|nr:serine hydrolase [Aquiflexum balticum]SMD42626.1 Beta-lactamase enzyme family protein [Aquiflexum balticum DSM 16537]